MKLTEFDYYLPPELIAQEPLEKRENSKLLVYKNNFFYHKSFNNIIDYLNKGDILVINNTKVIPAKLCGKKIPTGAKVEILLIKERKEKIWTCLVKPSRRIKTGTLLEFGDGLLTATVTGREPDGTRLITFNECDFKKILYKIGLAPLPPYIKKPLDDRNRYQTIYSKINGSIAAPTAGLHFTEDLLKKLENKGIIIANLTLHVGPGTFRPVKVENIEEHFMDEEFVHIEESEAEKINKKKLSGGKVIAVGTTSVRSLESAADEYGLVNSFKGNTDKFIYPGYKFRVIDGLITNFHLPKSTLFILVSAFIGIETTHKLYKKAIEMNYRFYSFGDACLLIK